jgi:recombination protein RecR
MPFPRNIQRAISLLSRLPAIGPKSAERIALYLIKKPATELEGFKEALDHLRLGKFCPICFNLTEDHLCSICQDPERIKELLCVTESPLDLMAIEEKAIYKGTYHVLGGTLGIGGKNNLNKLKITELKERILKEKIKEVIIATNFTSTGEATATLIKEILEQFPKLKITRLGRGLPTGGEIGYADTESMRESFNNRSGF